MASLKKSHVWFIGALVLLVVLPMLAQPLTGSYTAQIWKTTHPNALNKIVLEASKPDVFNIYNTNGTSPIVRGGSAVFCGSNATNVYQDIVSYATVKAQETIVLQAQATTKINQASNTGEDQFAIFAADDTTKYKGDEFGFVLPETGATWYAYIQSPKLPQWFVWMPILTLTSSVAAHNFEAVYSNAGLLSFVNFYVDGKLVWTTSYPNVSGQNYHMALVSHKVSNQNVDVSENTMQVESASLSSAVNAESFPYLNLF